MSSSFYSACSFKGDPAKPCDPVCPLKNNWKVIVWFENSVSCSPSYSDVWLSGFKFCTFLNSGEKKKVPPSSNRLESEPVSVPTTMEEGLRSVYLCDTNNRWWSQALEWRGENNASCYRSLYCYIQWLYLLYKHIMKRTYFSNMTRISQQEGSFPPADLVCWFVCTALAVCRLDALILTKATIFSLFPSTQRVINIQSVP